MNLVVISDLHLGPLTHERNRQFMDFLQFALQSGDEVLIAGDLFELWFGWPDLTFEFQFPMLETMRQLVSRGLVMDYVEGNHDFGITRYCRTVFRGVWNRSLTREWAGRRLHVEHGDLINKDDIPYRFWRAVSKNRVSFFLLDHLSHNVLLGLATQLERGLKKTNLKYKVEYPEQACKKFYMQQFEKGADIVIIGHFHQQKEIEIRLGNRNVLFYNLPGWEQGFRYLVVPKGNQKPYFAEWGRSNGNSSTP